MCDIFTTVVSRGRDFQHASEGAHFSDTLIDTGGFNPLLLSRCVRCAVKQRCWRISRNAFLQGGKSRATGGLREGSGRTVETFYLHGHWVRTLASELKPGKDGKKWLVKAKDHTGRNKSDHEPASAAAQQDTTHEQDCVGTSPCVSYLRSEVPRHSEAVGCTFHSCLACRSHSNPFGGPQICMMCIHKRGGVFRQMFWVFLFVCWFFYGGGALFRIKSGICVKLSRSWDSRRRQYNLLISAKVIFLVTFVNSPPDFLSKCL